MAVSALELRPRNGIALMDAALHLCARSTGVWALTLPGGAAVIGAMMYLVEAVRMGKPLLVPSLLFTLAWFLRGASQGAACHHVQALLLEGQGEPQVWTSVKAALGRLPSLFFAVGYLFGLQALLLLLTLGLGFLLLSAQSVSFAAVMQGRGKLWRLYDQCSRLLGPARGTAMAVRFLMGVQVLVFFNLHIALNFALMLTRKLVGIDLTFAERFASLDNVQWVLFLVALTFALFEPVRAATSTLLLVDGRVRSEGLDLLASVQQLPERNKARPPGVRGAAVLAVVLGLGLLVPTPARAEDEVEPRAPVTSARDASQRLSKVSSACEGPAPEKDERFARMAELSTAERGKLDRLVRAVERQAYDDEDCDSALLTLEQGLTQATGTLEAQTHANARAAADRARDILARPEFAVAPPRADDAEEPSAPPQMSWWTQFTTWLAKLLEDLFERDTPSTPPQALPSPGLVSGGQLADALVVVLVGLTVAVLGAVLWRALRKVRPTDEGSGLDVSTLDAATLARDPAHALSRPPEGWAQLADELAARGNYREAVRGLYLALLSRLHRDGDILYDVTLSNWDYLRQFKGRSEWKPRFRELTLRFDFAWYGNTPVTSTGYQEFRALTAPMLSAAPEAPGA
ncbi:hypothetical protein MYSTI_02863 [Myxococcus stipitatus DSM 14675]|uniref:Protein-glutamine gamma-glutamyltransferase-like C-terminal domain-containing protein n=1 Tax=Myxococcus stipitatus (strain DSM 14675 / JCM 12634 / Mx s8) TaxID=1278073 RepID=L7UCI7_MYXSD|nr:DUF4129 domain-containing protein [Myxococcus stipitatus]AGC44179.1 hypothetical protein MYSTI_02863 [Myxococcus stipitatus DSM 14675]